MNSTFFGLELSRRALESQQVALNISGHNVANANTDGYTRQIANLTATTPDTIYANGKTVSLGSGVTLDKITRARDAFIDSQFRSETTKQQYWATKKDNLSQIEEVLNEPSNNSLSSDMNKFWTAWSDLSKDPENAGARSVVSERAQELTDSFHNIAQQVSDIKDNTDESIKVQINQINNYAKQIKDLNDQIKKAEVAGDSPNDLKDQRDSIVDDLSKIVNVKVVETKDPSFADRDVSSYKVIIGNDSSTGNVLVDDSMYNTLQAAPTINANDIASVVWSDGRTLDLGSNLGTLSADLETRNLDIPEFTGQLDALAQGIADAVNALHRTGQGLSAETQTNSGKPIGIDFFTNGTDPSSSSYTTPATLPKVTAANISLNNTIKHDKNRIATGKLSTDGKVTTGDGTVARGISSLSSGWSALASQIADHSFTNTIAASSLSDFYAANVAQLGVKVQQATRMKAGEDVLVTNVSNQRESLSGVSLDEEMTNLIKYQKSYSAAARMVTMMDDMLSTLLNMGVTK